MLMCVIGGRNMVVLQWDLYLVGVLVGQYMCDFGGLWSGLVYGSENVGHLVA